MSGVGLTGLGHYRNQPATHTTAKSMTMIAAIAHQFLNRIRSLYRPFLGRAIALLLVATLGLGGCASAGVSGQMTGNYGQDTLALIETLRTTINLSNDAPNKAAAQAEARNLINDFASRYRRDAAVSGLSSFTTVSTALNAIAGHYSSYPNRPFPEKLKQRLEQEFRQVEAALRREG